MSAENKEMHGHEYDGISEYDNPLPAWWTAIFIGTFVFAVAYFIYYHVTATGMTPAQEYAEEMKDLEAIQAKAMSAAGALDADGWHKLVSDEAVLAEGRQLFAGTCAVCHGNRAEGLIGPNLTDRFWISGDGQPGTIFTLIRTGVPEKGMPPWEKRFAPKELQKLAAFVASLKGTNVPGKEPQGADVGAPAPEGAPPGGEAPPTPSPEGTPPAAAPREPAKAG